MKRIDSPITFVMYMVLCAGGVLVAAIWLNRAVIFYSVALAVCALAFIAAAVFFVLRLKKKETDDDTILYARISMLSTAIALGVLVVGTLAVIFM